MHVAVLGAGVVGMTTAYFLTQSGHDVTVIERDADVALACSYANGAQLSYSYVDAMASAAFLLKMPALLTGFDPAIRVRSPLTLDFLRWGLGFAAECTQKKATANTLANLKLARRSKELLDDLHRKLPGDFSHRTAGKLVLLGNKSNLDAAHRTAAIKTQLGCPASVVSLDRACEIEPAVAKMPGPYGGAIYSPEDDVGDSTAFARVLADNLRSRSTCQIAFNTTVEGVIVENRQVRAIETSEGQIDADAVVVCLGTWSPALLKPLGLNLPICPVRGYSVTLPPAEHSPLVSITDFGRRFVVSRIDEKIRVAGFADFVGLRTSTDERRINELLDVAKTNAPTAADYTCSDNQAWGGFRPLTPNGRPIVGATTIDGLYLNTGHGSYGWTLACATAEQVAELVEGERSAALAA
jgi:D-amino-acid dehydrogenase